MKFLALYAGVAGVAIFGQLMNASTILITLGLAGIATGVTKCIASTNSLKARVLIIATSFRMTLVGSIVVGMFLFLLSETLSEYILGEKNYSLVFRIFGLSITFACLNNWLLSVFNGFKEYKLYTYSNLASSALIALLTAGFVYAWGSEGALVAFVLGQSVILLVSLGLSKKVWLRHNLFKFGFDSGVARQLFGFSVTTLAGTILLPLSQIVVRTFIIEDLSVNEAGIWEGLSRISFVYLSVLTSSIQIYYLPRLAEIKSNTELVTEVKKTYQLVIPPLIVAGVSIFLLKDFVINLLFTPDFLPMRDLFAWQLIGDLLKISSWLLAFVMPARGLIKSLLVTEIVFNCTYVLFSYAFLRLFGLEGVPMGYAVNYLLYGVVVLLIVRSHVKSK